MANRMELYKAVKWEVEHFQADHGFTLVQLWKVVNYDLTQGTVDWCTYWRNTCLDDYKERVCI